VTEEQDSKISDLYCKSSQETPPAHLDRQVLEMARKSVRRRSLSPFGNHWVAGGALASVVLISVLLILTLPQQPDRYLMKPAAVEQLREAQHADPEEGGVMHDAPEEGVEKLEAKRSAPAAARPRVHFYTLLPEAEVADPGDEARARKEQMLTPVPAAEEADTAPGILPEENYYLQAGSFRNKASAVEMKNQLLGLGFECEIQEVSFDGDEPYHRVRVGPFTSRDSLGEARQKLEGQGIETRIVTGKD